MPRRPTRNGGNRVFTVCDVCQRLVYVDDVDAEGRCCFCQPPPAPKPPEGPPVTVAWVKQPGASAPEKEEKS